MFPVPTSNSVIQFVSYIVKTKQTIFYIIYTRGDCSLSHVKIGMSSISLMVTLEI